MHDMYMASMPELVARHFIDDPHAYPEICPANLTSQSGQFPGQDPPFSLCVRFSAKH